MRAPSAAGGVGGRTPFCAAKAAMVRIDVIIRNPNAHGEVDFQMEAQDNQTVLDLKMRLQNEYPTQPSVKAQTLIHGGRVLRGDSKLCDVVSKVSFPSFPPPPRRDDRFHSRARYHPRHSCSIMKRGRESST